MSYYRRRKSAYYSRNDSYSRSYNAECAEAEVRLPLTRAASYLGLSVSAFRAGYHNQTEYTSHEWHHVGKYAMSVTYYDSELLSSIPDFWFNAAKAYKTKTKVSECVNKGLQALSQRNKIEY